MILQKNLTIELKKGFYRKVFLPIFSIGFIGIFFQLILTIQSNNSLEIQINESIANSISDSINKKDLISIQRTVKAFILANKDLVICIQLPEGTYLEHPSCQNAQFLNYTTPLSNKNFAVSVKIPFLLSVSIIGLVFLNCLFLLLVLVSKYLNQLSKLISQDLNHLGSTSIEKLPIFFEEIQIARTKIEEGIRAKTDKITTKIALQVAHDIRSPLAALEMVKNDFTDISKDQKELMETIINRVKSIANDLLSNVRKFSTENNNLPTNFETCIQKNLNAIFIEKKFQFKNLPILFELKSQIHDDLTANIDPEMFKRIISNIVNNSVEAFNSEGKIVINAEIDSDNLCKIVISDNGKGIPADKIAKILSAGLSFGKENGHGIGLLSAKEYLESINGSLTLTSEIGIGTTVSIFFPATYLKGANYILVDDDELVRMIWEKRALAKSINLKTFSTSDDFLKNLHLFSKDTFIYIDSELGIDDKGETILIKLHSLGFINLHMCTGYSKENFKHLVFLKGILDKSPPFY